MRLAITAAFALALSLSTSSCATIVLGRTATIAIKSSPPGASYEILDEECVIAAHGTTPETEELLKSREWFKAIEYTVNFKLEGYEPLSVPIRQSPHAAYVLGNLVSWDFIGWLLIDPGTGSMWRIHDVEDAIMTPLGQGAPTETAAE